MYATETDSTQWRLEDNHLKASPNRSPLYSLGENHTKWTPNTLSREYYIDSIYDMFDNNNEKSRLNKWR